MSLTIPGTLKLAQLKQLAFKCGILTSGTKPILIRRLQDEIGQSQSNNGPKKAGDRVRILSIDMGIRNLAYCVLDVPVRPLIRPGAIIGKGEDMKRTLPSILDWHRIAVSSPPVAIPSSGNTIGEPPPREAFDPATLSQAAYTLLRTQLLPSKPTHILIERQRFRSMGSSHILEWTVRVNMFESMLYAVLCTLKAEGLWDGSVKSILPKKVGPYWIGEEEAGGVDIEMVDREEKGRRKVRKTTSAKIKNKGAKIDLVRSWLESKDMVELGNEGVEEIARQYVEKWDRAPGGRKAIKGANGEVEEPIGKLDDLADCLLQGMAWIEWEENKRVVIKYGIEALLDP